MRHLIVFWLLLLLWMFCCILTCHHSVVRVMLNTWIVEWLLCVVWERSYSSFRFSNKHKMLRICWCQTQFAFRRQALSLWSVPPAVWHHVNLYIPKFVLYMYAWYPPTRNKLLSSTIVSLRLPESARKERACLLPRLSSSLTTPSHVLMGVCKVG